MQYILFYLGAISLIAIILTLRDKSAAKNQKWRIKERSLLIVAALGGSVAMIVTMRAIRHKTRRAKFMVGIPVIIALQVAAALAFLWWRGL